MKIEVTRHKLKTAEMETSASIKIWQLKTVLHTHTIVSKKELSQLFIIKQKIQFYINTTITKLSKILYL